MKLKVINKNTLLLTSLMMWLLLLCSSYESVANEIIKPKLVLSKKEIDLCRDVPSEREFVISVDLGRVIRAADSLILCEVVLAYSKKIILDGILTIGTLSEMFTNYAPTYRVYTEGIDYNEFVFEAGNIIKPIHSNQNLPLINITGRYIGNDVNCVDFFIESFFLNEEFKIDYVARNSDTVVLCAGARNLPDRRVDLYAKNDTFVIEKIDDKLNVDYELSVTNKRFLESFTVEFAVSSESLDKIEISDFDINEQFEYNLIEKDSAKIILDISIKDTANFSQTADFGSLQLIRKNKDSSENKIICRVFNINESSCSMNNEDTETKIICLEDPTTVEDEGENVTLFFSETEQKVYINANINDLKKVKIYDVIGRELLYNKEIHSASLATVDVSFLKRGVYFFSIEKNNSTQSIKLSIK